MAFFDDGVWALSCCASLRSSSEIFSNAFASSRSSSEIFSNAFASSRSSSEFFFNAFTGLCSSSAILSNALPKLSCRISNCCLSTRCSVLSCLYSFVFSDLPSNDEHAFY